MKFGNIIDHARCAIYVLDDDVSYLELVPYEVYKAILKMQNQSDDIYEFLDVELPNEVCIQVEESDRKWFTVPPKVYKIIEDYLNKGWDKAYKRWTLNGFNKSYNASSKFSYEVSLIDNVTQETHIVEVTFNQYNKVQKLMTNKLKCSVKEPTEKDETILGFWEYRLHCAMYNWMTK